MEGNANRKHRDSEILKIFSFNEICNCGFFPLAYSIPWKHCNWLFFFWGVCVCLLVQHNIKIILKLYRNYLKYAKLQRLSSMFFFFLFWYVKMHGIASVSVCNAILCLFIQIGSSGNGAFFLHSKAFRFPSSPLTYLRLAVASHSQFIYEEKWRRK